MAGKLARDDAVQKCVGPEPSLVVSGQNMRRKTKRWMDNQQLAMWHGLSSTQRLARELVSGPNRLLRPEFVL